jgi:serine/threonine-protein phosphatase PP1 catalytic subunit
MSVSEDLLCSFELLKPLDGAALKKEMTKSKRKSCVFLSYYVHPRSGSARDKGAELMYRSLQNHQSPPNNPMTQSY